MAGAPNSENAARTTEGQRDLARRMIEEFAERGFCILPGQFAAERVEVCRSAFWPRLMSYIANRADANRGPGRYFLPIPFEFSLFHPEFFFDHLVLSIVGGLMDERIVADQWGCDAPIRGSEYQNPHVDYQRPLFAEAPDMELPPWAIVVSFGLVRITEENGPIEIAPTTHRMKRAAAIGAVESGRIALHPVCLEIGDVLIRHPWALHRGTPNLTDTPRALATIRYVRRWYADMSREVETIPRKVWESLTPEQRLLLRFPVER